MSALTTPRGKGVGFTVERLTSRADWLERRKTGIGASECAAVVGLDPYKSPLEIFMEKVGLIAPRDFHGYVGQSGSDKCTICGKLEKENPPHSDAIQTGLDLEDYVAQRYERKTGREVMRIGTAEKPALWRSRANPFMIATPDRRIVGMNRGLECKTAGYWAGQSEEWGDPENVKDAVPIRYHCQTMHSLLVAQWDAWELCALVAGQRIAGPYVIEYDEELASWIVDGWTDVAGVKHEGERAFWQRVERGREMLEKGVDPKQVIARVGPSSTRASDLALRFDDSQRKPIEATLPLVKIFDELMDFRKATKSAEEQIEARKLAICDYMGEHDELVYQGTTLCTWRTSKPRATFNAAEHAKDQPECHVQYAGVGAAPRPFVPKEPK